MEGDDRVRRVPVGAEHAGERLDRALALALPELSRSRLKALILSGFVRIGGRPARPSHLVEPGQVAEVDLAGAAAAAAPVTFPPIRVLFEDEWVVVVDKPPGLSVHPNDGGPADTLADWAEARFGPLPREEEAPERPGVVHRLDRETSGVLVLARTPAAMAALKGQFRSRVTKKEYVALVHGVPQFASDYIEKPLARDPLHPERMRVRPEEGRESLTFYQVQEDLGRWAWLLVRPETGRTHQIRVHLASIGHSVVGDRLYRSAAAQRHPLPPGAPTAGRHALHARSLAFLHPAREEPVTFEAEVPQDLERLLEWLRAQRRGRP